MNKPPMIILLGLVVIAFFATRQYLHQRRENADNDAAPVREIAAEVVAKRDYLSPNRRSRQREEIPAEDRSYEAYFKPQAGGAEIKLKLEMKDYDALTKGQKGILSVKGTRFIAFKETQ
jgi:hypothetical protein